jgi:hypothetical protein
LTVAAAAALHACDVLRGAARRGSGVARARVRFRVRRLSA